ncbi:extracellular matrix protein 1 [Dromaius novaehollandiae]|uniref:extracellular matrix protein 1 n=1 Tax=Dromaius novaehollandiae TaxID=8790 RepID=UPI00311DAC79
MAAFLLLLLLAAGAGAEVPAGPPQGLEQTEQLLQLEQAPLLPAAAQEERHPPVPPPRWGGDLEGFPPARPATAAAVAALCRRPPAPAADPFADLPPTGFSHLRRQAAALHRLAGRLGPCCRQPRPLPCAQQAWAEELEGFCADEFRVKTRHYPCCKRPAAERPRCFEEAAPPPAAPAALRSPPPPPSPAFPPGEPTAANMANVCRLRRFRPAPDPAAFPASGFGAAKSRARALARLERGYKGCCRAGGLPCARAAWRQALGRFCEEESAVKTKQHRCCRRGAGEARWRCFAAEAPHPAYDRPLRNVSLARLGPPLLDALCGPARLLTKQKPVPALVQSITAACCPRDPADRPACAEEEKSRAIAALCSSQRASWKDPQRCCDAADAELRRRCFDTSYLANVALASAAPELLPPAPSAPPAPPSPGPPGPGELGL